MALTPVGKRVFSFLAYAMVAGIVFFSARTYAPDFWNKTVGSALGWAFPGVKAKPAVLAGVARLPGSFTPMTNTGVPEKLPPPGARLSSLPGESVRVGTYFWSGNMAFHYAFGGAPTSEDGVFGTSQGSLMEKYGVKIRWRRIDDTGPMIEQTMSFARAYRQDRNTQAGIHGFTIMGDGAAAALTNPNGMLEKELGPDYIIQAVAFFGASNGEDGLWGPPAWRSNPQLARGSIIAVVSTGDVGDFNVVAMWADINKIPLNMDQTAYDPNAINILNPATYIDTGVKFVTRHRDTRYYTIVNGKREKKTTVRELDGYCSWTPVDYDVAKQRQDVVRIYSTRDNTSQMPCTFFVVKKWADDNRQLLNNLIAAVGEAGRQIKHHESALDAACEISARIYRELPEKDGPWIKRFYKGDVHRDSMGRPVMVGGYMMELGGSRVFDIADMMYFMGILPGYESVPKYREVYETFGDIFLRVNPELLPNGSYMPANRVINSSFVQEVARVYMSQFSGQMAAATAPSLPGVGGEATEDVVGHSNWTIEFATGSSELTPAGGRELEKLYRQVSTGNMALEVHGHTDKTGDRGQNLVLSDDRAKSVRSWLMRRSPMDFPDKRVLVFPHGQDQPLDTADTPEAYAKNRRVEIYLRRVNM